MNRLFGVTLAERGVSQLVSVDLETAEKLREAGDGFAGSKASARINRLRYPIIPASKNQETSMASPRNSEPRHGVIVRVPRQGWMTPAGAREGKG